MSSIKSPTGWGRAAWTAIRGARGTHGWGHVCVSQNFSMPKTDANPWTNTAPIPFPIFSLPPSSVVGRWYLEAATAVTTCEVGQNTPIIGNGSASNGTRMWLQLSEDGNTAAAAGDDAGSKQLTGPFINTAVANTDPVFPLRKVVNLTLASSGVAAERYFSSEGNTIISLAVQRAGTGDDMSAAGYAALSGLTLCVTLFFRVQPPNR